MTAETLGDLLAEYNLRPRHYRAGSTHRLKCPSCNAKDEDSFSLIIDVDGRGFTGNCHRGKCGHVVGAKLKQQSEKSYVRPEDYRRPAKHAVEVTEAGFDVYAWFGRRAIDADTVDLFGVYSMDHKFYDKQVHPAIVWPYKFNNEVVNRKYRGFDDKGLMGQEYQPLPTLYNVDSIDEPDVIIWVEGECDVMAVHQSGFKQIVSLKDGSSKKLKAEDDPSRADDKRFAALTTHADLLSSSKKHILAGDMDEPGEILKLELARRLGRHKCFLVTWPTGCKDANDTLLRLGPEAVRDAIDGAAPYPIEGVQRSFKGRLSAYLRLPPPPVMLTGVSTVNDVLSLPGEGRIIVITGTPNSGKTKWAMNAMVYLMMKYGRRFAVFSPEFAPFDEFLVEASSILVGKPARKPRRGNYNMLMDVEEQDRAAEWFFDKLFYIESDLEDVPPTLSWIFDVTRSLILRHGVTDLMIDPFNEVEADRGSFSETEYIGRCLQKARSFARRHGCNVWIICHPTKMQPAKGETTITAPGPYDIAGSAHWANKADVGITIHTPKDITTLFLWKCRFSRFGRKGSSAEMAYDEATCRYHSPDAPQDVIRLPYAD